VLLLAFFFIFFTNFPFMHSMHCSKSENSNGGRISFLTNLSIISLLVLGLARTEAARAAAVQLGGDAVPCRAVPDLGTTVKPLDGGALTLRWTRAPARGLVVAPLAPRRR
jgi:hypothetical protein